MPQEIVFEKIIWSKITFDGAPKFVGGRPDGDVCERTLFRLPKYANAGTPPLSLHHLIIIVFK